MKFLRRLKANKLCFMPGNKLNIKSIIIGAMMILKTNRMKYNIVSKRVLSFPPAIMLLIT